MSEVEVRRRVVDLARRGKVFAVGDKGKDIEVWGGRIRGSDYECVVGLVREAARLMGWVGEIEFVRGIDGLYVPGGFQVRPVGSEGRTKGLLVEVK